MGRRNRRNRQRAAARTALRLRDFLDEVDGVESIQRSAVACLWRKLVNYKEDKTAEIAANGDVGGLRDGPEDSSSKPYLVHTPPVE